MRSDLVAAGVSTNRNYKREGKAKWQGNGNGNSDRQSIADLFSEYAWAHDAW
jgi:hypothetical protein